MKHIAVFASGEGSNAQQLIDYFKTNGTARVSLVVTNNPKANVLDRAKNAKVASILIHKKNFNETTYLLDELKKHKIDFIALAGFLWLLPSYLTKAYPNKILNIHPALLPKYGGKGMYGAHVHESVIANKDSQSGISIHYVNEKYDDGQLILQIKCKVNSEDTVESLARKIHQLEYCHYAAAIEKIISEMQT